MYNDVCGVTTVLEDGASFRAANAVLVENTLTNDPLGAPLPP